MRTSRAAAPLQTRRLCSSADKSANHGRYPAAAALIGSRRETSYQEVSGRKLLMMKMQAYRGRQPLQICTSAC
jgi:hypothetical protein